MLDNKRVLITGGTGSLGRVLVRRLLSGEMGRPRKIIVFSRDEAKQHFMRLKYMHQRVSTDEVIYRHVDQILEFRIGDVRDFASLAGAMHDVDVVFNAAALKQVPTCEYFPYQAVLTNVIGPENLVRAIEELQLPVETVVGVSTDKACKPVNVMGMTKAIQERILIQGNIRCPRTRFICVRYGNVLASRGSVIPLFHEQIRNGGPVTITTPEMTRFLLSLDQAVDTIFAAVKNAKPGETYVPSVPSARVIDIAAALIGERNIEVAITGIRPGEKIHEVLVSEEERFRTVDHGDFYAIAPILPELRLGEQIKLPLKEEYSSARDLMAQDQIIALLHQQKLMVEDVVENGQELLR
jgi:UDP-glucose 4-epimerase